MNYQICTNCVMDTTDPDITFDEKGVCNHCQQFAQMEMQRRIDKQNFHEVLETLREAGEGKEYDCLLGLSGGVDSSTCLVRLVENGIRPLCFSLDNGWNTKEADENIMRLVEGLKVPFFRYSIDLKEFKRLQTAFLKSGTPNVEIPTDHVIMAATYEMAKENKIKYIISGGNIATEGIMPPAWGYNAKDLTFLQAVYAHFNSGETIKNLPTISLFQYIVNRFVRGIRVVYLLDYYEYNRNEAISYLQKKFGWKDYGEKHGENTFTRWFQTVYLPKLFGYDKRRAHYSSMINSKQMTREAALKELEKPLDEVNLDYEWLTRLQVPIKRTYKDYRNAEFWWNLLSKIYQKLK